MSEPVTDVLGAPYTAETIELPDDSEGRVVATLVKRPAHTTTRKAVLYVHGFCDYFFQTAYAEWWTERGYDFYALDLRKYGRSLLPHQTPNYVADLREYWPELDAAWQRVTERDGHDHVVLSAHSTGGLTLPLWASERRVPIAGMVLNSPWFDLQGSAVERGIGTRVIHRIAAVAPMRTMPRTVSGLYTQSLHVNHSGEFDFELSWKPVQSWPVRFGWISAIRRGHAELHRGLAIEAPVLVLSSAASTWPAEMSDAVHTHDIVLDVQQIRRWASSLGTHVTSVAIDGGRHDLSLSRLPAREAFYAEIGRWADAYLS
ncbi:alpha/beta hydrolase [Nocardioides sp.]|uniref:alpha/beta hydrolase n=1 Tax=Nocardioides sp. TaxID=35761 RepID=UPI002BE0D84C|nr:alpha/beta hydrolase [Nocardioides sp.]HSX69113.1 alpha/beta hydrolase [Nocardioides sp.]